MSTENYAYQNPDEEVRTLFISGLPEDVKEREIHNLFRLCRGYEGCKLTLSQGKPVAFASFADRNAAITAQTSLHNIKFDPSFHQTLRIEMAKSNSKTKRLLDEPDTRLDSRRREPTWRPNDIPPPGGMYFHDSYPPPSQSSYPPYPSWGYPPDRPDMFQMAVGPGRKNTAPCTTLYVAGIEPHVGEENLTRLFSSIPGFKKVLLTQKENSTFAFVEYTDIQSSTQALCTFNNVQIGNSHVRIEFARNKMGERAKSTNMVSNNEGLEMSGTDIIIQ
eukprot:TRINITY_DN1835_c0_g2_i5.p1 TRINITY_DN1835_c0_g2~~TRINITY_DN1835_c0_g2_i5.p1  ORF type:complete len:276 (+),score=24.00 TRINITY_DN1835_c0_g2_i5:1-828(+)